MRPKKSKDDNEPRTIACPHKVISGAINYKMWKVGVDNCDNKTCVFIFSGLYQNVS